MDTPFDIPDSWEWIRFKDLVDYSMGKTPPRKETEYWSNGTLPWVSIADLVADGTVTETKECVNDYAAEHTFKSKISKAGTLLMSFKLTVGKVSILGIDAFHNEAIISIYPFVDPDRITTMFLFALLPLLSQSGDTKSAIKGNTLNSDSLDALLIPLPPIQEQKRIFAKLQELTAPLNDYDVAEQKASELNASFPEALKKSILQEAVQGKLVPQDPSDEPAEALLERIRAEKQRLIKEGKIKKDKHESVIFRRDNSHYEKRGSEEVCIDDEIPFDIPENWCWCRFSNVIELQSGQDLTSEKFNDQGDGIPYITGASNIVNENVKINRWTKFGKSFAYKNDLLITCKGTVGSMAFLRVEKAHIARQIMAINSNGSINTLYIKIVLETLVASLKASAKSMIPGISRDDILNSLLPLPPLKEQHRIVATYKSILPALEQL